MFLFYFKSLKVDTKFDLTPESSEGTKRAVLIGINYTGQQGELKGCHNDVLNMKEYIINVHGFEEDNITVLMDDGEHTEPTKDNIMAAYDKIAKDSKDGDVVFCHFSGNHTLINTLFDLETLCSIESHL